MIVDKSKVHNIPVDRLLYNENLPRQNIDIETLVRLSHSNIPHDLPLVSTTYSTNPQQEEHVTILLSNLLFKIRKLQNVKKIPVVFYHQLETQELLFLYTNYKRYNLINYLEEAIILHQLNKEGFTHKQIANVLGVSRSYITNKIRFITQPKELIESLINNEITEGHAKLLMGLKDKITKLNLLEIVRTENLSVKDTAKLIQNFKGIKPTEHKLDKDITKLIQQLTNALKNMNIKHEINVPRRKRQYIAKINIVIKDKNQLKRFIESFKQ